MTKNEKKKIEKIYSEIFELVEKTQQKKNMSRKTLDRYFRVVSVHFFYFIGQEEEGKQ